MDYKKLSFFLVDLLILFVFAFIIVPWCCGYELQFIGLGGWSLEETYQVAGVVAPFIAIFVAVEIPKIIADRQDKIALFEKRLDLYSTFEEIRIFMEQAESLLRGGETVYADFPAIKNTADICLLQQCKIL